MPTFSEHSRAALDSADPKLRAIFDEVIKFQDCTVLCGFRNEKEQGEAFAKGFSKVEWPNSKHNTFPSRAVDVAPWPLDWNEPRRFYFFAGYVKAVAERLGTKIRWGGDFGGDGNLTNDKFVDLPHYELVE